MKREILLLRLAGLFLLVLCLYLFLSGNLHIPAKYKDVEIQLPLSVLTGLAGVWLLSHPISFLWSVSWLLQEDKSKRFQEWLKSLGAPAHVHLAENATPIEIISVVNRFMLSYHRRLAIFVIILVAFVFFVLPALVIRVARQNNVEERVFLNESSYLVRLVQEEPIEYAARDTYRRYLLDAKDSVEKVPDTTSSTRRIYNILLRLYAVNSREEFSREEDAIYENEIASHIPTGNNWLRLDEIIAPQSTSESPTARVTLFTLLAIFCIHHGNQGAFANDYVRALQLLIKDLDPRYENIPAWYNAKGNALYGILAQYDYVRQHADADSSMCIQTALGMNKLPSPLDLLNTATDAYKKAAN